MKHSHLVVTHAACAVLCAAVLCIATRASADSPPASAETAVSEPVTGTVNINTASAAELERLPGIGPSRARAILALRAQLTKFTRLEELLRVKGIGRATFRRLRPMLSLDGATTLREPARSG